MILFAQLAMHFEPAFVFPGERFAVVAQSGASVTSNAVLFQRRGDRWLGTAPASPIEIVATLGQPGSFSDATKRILPVATNKRYTVGATTIVLLQGGGYAAILDGKRFADLFVFNLSARSSPVRPREFIAGYIYAGPTQITILGEAGGVVRAAATITAAGIDVNCSTLFDVAGKLKILNREFEFPRSPPGFTRRMSYEF